MTKPSSLLPSSIGLIGAGQMAEAILRGLIHRGVSRECLMASDPDPARRDLLSEQLGIRMTPHNAEVAKAVELAVIAVKPAQLELAGADLRSEGDPLYLSILAGRTLSDLSAALGPRVARAMPNTPALIGRGVTALACPPELTSAERTQLTSVLAAIGEVVLVPESSLDAVTGLSGSGPAYVYLIIEALTDAGIREGLSAATARQLAAQTVSGAAQMVLETGEHPAVLRQKVLSPGGTTAAGVAALEQGGVRAALLAAVRSASERSRELSSAKG